jgi:hypothetical protein
LAGVDALDVPESGISRKLGLASGLGVFLIPQSCGSLSFRRVGLGEYCPDANPSVDFGSGVPRGVRTYINIGGKLLICNG